MRETLSRLFRPRVFRGISTVAREDHIPVVELVKTRAIPKRMCVADSLSGALQGSAVAIREPHTALPRSSPHADGSFEILESEEYCSRVKLLSQLLVLWRVDAQACSDCGAQKEKARARFEPRH